MDPQVTRRAALVGAYSLLTLVGARAEDSKEALAAIERRHGGRLGVFVLDTGSSAQIAHRADERFPMCSTFKLLAVAAVLKRVDAGKERLDRKIPYGSADLQDYAPITKAHVGDGAMALGEVCAAALQWSDNTAANLLLRILGGPAAVTGFARSLDDSVTRLDRWEPDLNTSIPNDVRDTTSPRVMLRDMQAILLQDVLLADSRRQLITWLIGDKVSANRLRAGVPPNWVVGDKTGSGDHGTANTIAIMWPPERAPFLATVYYTGSSEAADARNALHAEVGRLLAEAL